MVKTASEEVESMHLRLGRTFGAVLGSLVCSVLLGGCGGSAEDDPGRVADAFERAVAGGDAQSACSLLASATLDELEQSSGEPCAQSVLDEVQPGGARAGVSRFGTAAQAKYGADVLFLTDGPQGWRVTAAGCRPTREAGPYDCGISGG